MNVNDMERQDKVLLSKQQQPSPRSPSLQRKRYHGNRRNQRFRRKCRTEKIKPAKIEKIIKKRNRVHQKDQNKNSGRYTTNTNGTSALRKSELMPSRKRNQSQLIPITTTTNLNKRKRDISSQQLSSSSSSSSIINPANRKATSSISTVETSSKKLKHISGIMSNYPIISSNDDDMNRNTSYRYVCIFQNFNRTTVDH